MARVHPIGVPRGGKDKWIVKGGCVNSGWSVMSIIVSGNERWSGGLLCKRVEPGDGVFLDGSRVQCSSNLAAVVCFIVFVEGSSRLIRDLDLVKPIK